jgi:FKBP-type peptidyl-prolyl cis-trans isomerase 2
MIVGIKKGRHRTMEITAERRPEPKKDDYLVRMARTRRREKEIRLTPEEYRQRTGKTAEVGKPFPYDPSMSGRVASVTDREVVVRFNPRDGVKKIATPFGEGRIEERDDRYEIVIDARPGALVRSAGFVGRVTCVDDRFITIDYGYPFGGEPLLCDVLVESIAPAVR